jgi:hypothetical protein
VIDYNVTFDNSRFNFDTFKDFIDQKKEFLTSFMLVKREIVLFILIIF